jgi:dolichol kinase
MGLADTAATLVGKHMQAQRWPLLKSPKTIEGTLAFMVVSAAILFALGDNSVAIVLGTSIIVAVVEMISGRGVDNATVPLATVLILR